MKSLKTMTFALLITGLLSTPWLFVPTTQKRPTSSHLYPENLRRAGEKLAWGHG